MTLRLEGRMFGALIAIAPTPRGRWRCRCSCGVEVVVETNKLTSGWTRSCGHLRSEALVARSTKHGCAPRGGKTRTYRIWRNMVTRCTDPNTPAWKRYGGRGISVAPEWRDFRIFLSDMGEAPANLTLERKDNDLGYSKSNCVWATRAQQARNTVSNRNLTFSGETLCLLDWAHKLGVNRATVYAWVGRWGDVEGIARLCTKHGYPHVE